MIEDELLKLRFKHGSRDSLSRIYEKYLSSLLTLAMALLNDTSAAEDVVHDVFVSFAQSAGQFGLIGSLRSYLATCVVNRARDYIRANKRRAARLDVATCEQSSAPSPDAEIVCSEQSRLVNLAMTQLPYEQREVIALRLKSRMKFGQIASLQDVSVSTVQGRYRYGLNKLRSILDGRLKE
ncbi:MAG: sigma-70 family RNA polymerase sigma factor [Phycisphaerales bacterium]|nr:MAG: sigma-70 family RNA polymerase sigma factor [Phycisphaerales bacterium]